MMPTPAVLAMLDADQARLLADLAALAPEPDRSLQAGRETERTMLDRLNRRYAYVGGNGMRYARAEHVKVAAGHYNARICDYMALDLWPGVGPGKGTKLHGHEVKVSRADWLTELRDPDKAEAFASLCDHWWLVVSDASIVRDGELPPGWGLLAASGPGLRVVVDAPRRDPAPPTKDLLATFARAVTKTTLRLSVTGGDTALTTMARRMQLT
nr:hypothetical protein [Cellulomonas hominis]